MDKKLVVTDRSYITDECWKWVLGSDANKQILLIHPLLSSVFYIFVKEQRHAKVNLDESQWDSFREIWKIDLIGRNLLLGEYTEGKLHLWDLVVTKDGAFAKCDSTMCCSVDATNGRFAAFCHPMNDDEKQQKQLLLFTPEYSWKDKCTFIREHKMVLFGNDVTSESDDSSSEPAQSLRVKGRLFPHCVIDAHTSCPVLIGRNRRFDTMFGMELNGRE